MRGCVIKTHKSKEEVNYWIDQKPALLCCLNLKIYLRSIMPFRMWDVGRQNYNLNIKTIPGGIPASSARAPSARADNGVSSAGLTTQVHPAARAAATWARVCTM